MIDFTSSRVVQKYVFTMLSFEIQVQFSVVITHVYVSFKVYECVQYDVCAPMIDHIMFQTVSKHASVLSHDRVYTQRYNIVIEQYPYLYSQRVQLCFCALGGRLVTQLQLILDFFSFFGGGGAVGLPQLQLFFNYGVKYYSQTQCCTLTLLQMPLHSCSFVQWECY